MKSTVQILDAIKAKHRLPSDYALHKLLDITRQQVSKYRNGDPLSEETAIKCADLLGTERGIVLAWIAGERAKTPSSRDAWRLLAERLGGTAAAILFVWLFFGSGAESQTLAALFLPAIDGGAVCIMLNQIFLIILFVFSVIAFHPHKKH